MLAVAVDVPPTAMADIPTTFMNMVEIWAEKVTCEVTTSDALVTVADELARV